MLTNTAYLSYVQCAKQFWLDQYQPNLAAPPDPSSQRRLRAGQEVDKRARAQFSDGLLTPYRPHPEDMAPLSGRGLKCIEFVDAQGKANGLLYSLHLIRGKNRQ
jgi:hypothetical protein